MGGPVWERFQALLALLKRSSDQTGCVLLLILFLGAVVGLVFWILASGDGGAEDEQTPGSPTTAIFVAPPSVPDAPTIVPTEIVPAATVPAATVPAELVPTETVGAFTELVPNDSDVRFGDENSVSLVLPAGSGMATGEFRLVWSFGANPETEFLFAGTLEGTYDADTGTIQLGTVTVTDESQGFLRETFAPSGTGLWGATIVPGVISGTINAPETALLFTVPLPGGNQ